jgi:rhodanese-related sulfurtransferase
MRNSCVFFHCCIYPHSVLFLFLANSYAADDNASKQSFTNLIISYDDVKKVIIAPEKTIILDLRRNSDYDKDTLTMPAARRFDPDKIAEWSTSIPKDKEIVLFCVHGRSISDASVKYLNASGFNHFTSRIKTGTWCRARRAFNLNRTAIRATLAN